VAGVDRVEVVLWVVVGGWGLALLLVENVELSVELVWR